jgi:plastocyanin
MTILSRRTAISALAAAPLAIVIGRPAQAATHHVTIKGFQYHPPALEVAVGDRVVFTNQDSTPHTATALFKRWDTAQLGRGKSAKIVISSAGDHSYYCRPHPAMKGVIWAV